MMAPAAALLSTEAFKLRRTLGLRMTAAAPVFAILLELPMLFNRRAFPVGDASTVWRSLYRGGWLFWIGFFVPVLVAFEAASLANVEHRGKQWKQLFASPIPRWSVYAVKMLFCGLLVGASFAIVVPGLVGDVLIYSAANGYRMAPAIPWSEVVDWAGRAWLASWLVVVLQSWLSVRFTGIAPPVGIALAGLVLGVVVQGSVLAVSISVDGGAADDSGGADGCAQHPVAGGLWLRGRSGSGRAGLLGFGAAGGRLRAAYSDRTSGLAFWKLARFGRGGVCTNHNPDRRRRSIPPIRYP